MNTNGEPGEVTNLASDNEVFCVLESAHLFLGFTIIFIQARLFHSVNALCKPIVKSFIRNLTTRP